MDDVSRLTTSGRRTRGQGRPRQSESEVGRDRLIERTRAAMNLRPRTDIQRREIADVIGVTPALITYYFPDKWSLLEAAAHPVITEHVAAIDHMLASQGSHMNKLKVLIRIYLMFNRDYGYLLDYYISAGEKLDKPKNLQLLVAAHTSIVGFFSDGIANGVFKDTNAGTLQSLLWCICQYLGRIPESQYAPALTPREPHKLMEHHQDLVLELFADGVFQPAIRQPETAVVD